MIHLMFAQTYRIYTTKSERQWTLSGYDVSTEAHRCNKCTTLVADVGNGGGYACVKTPGVRRKFL